MPGSNMSVMSRLLTLFLLLVAGTAWATSPTKPPSGPEYAVIAYYHNDVSGSPLAATDGHQYVIWREEYSPYGERVLRDPGASNNHLWFTGHPHDEDSGLTYAGARHYDPMIGRFMSVDPIPLDAANPFTFNRYAYGNNNPYTYEDPDGREPGDAAFGLAVGMFMRPEDARKVQQAEAAIGNSHIAGSIDTGIALRSAREAASRGATGKEIIATAAATYFGVAAVQKGSGENRLDDDALVVRGGENITAESIKVGSGMHPSGVEGFSVESKNGKTLCELCVNIPNGTVGVTTAGEVRKAGGDVVSTSGRSPNHATVTGLDPQKAADLLKPAQNPVPAAQRNFRKKKR